MYFTLVLRYDCSVLTNITNTNTRININLFLWKAWGAFGRDEIQIHLFSTSVQFTGKWSSSHQCRSSPVQIIHDIHSTECWMDSKSVWTFYRIQSYLSVSIIRPKWLRQILCWRNIMLSVKNIWKHKSMQKQGSLGYAQLI